MMITAILSTPATILLIALSPGIKSCVGLFLVPACAGVNTLTYLFAMKHRRGRPFQMHHWAMPAPRDNPDYALHLPSTDQEMPGSARPCAPLLRFGYPEKRRSIAPQSLLICRFHSTTEDFSRRRCARHLYVISSPVERFRQNDDCGVPGRYSAGIHSPLPGSLSPDDASFFIIVLMRLRCCAPPALSHCGELATMMSPSTPHALRTSWALFLAGSASVGCPANVLPIGTPNARGTPYLDPAHPALPPRPRSFSCSPADSTSSSWHHHHIHRTSQGLAL